MDKEKETKNVISEVKETITEAKEKDKKEPKTKDENAPKKPVADVKIERGKMSLHFNTPFKDTGWNTPTWTSMATITSKNGNGKEIEILCESGENREFSKNVDKELFNETYKQLKSGVPVACDAYVLRVTKNNTTKYYLDEFVYEG